MSNLAINTQIGKFTPLLYSFESGDLEVIMCDQNGNEYMLKEPLSTSDIASLPVTLLNNEDAQQNFSNDPTAFIKGNISEVILCISECEALEWVVFDPEALVFVNLKPLKLIN